MCLKEALTDKINCESRKSKDLIWRKEEQNENHNKLLWYNYSFKIATIELITILSLKCYGINVLSKPKASL